MPWSVHAQMIFQASQYFCLGTLLGSCNICNVCQSMCPFPLTLAWSGRYIVCGRRWCMTSCQSERPFPDSISYRKFIATMRTMAWVSFVPLWESSCCTTGVTASTSMVRLWVMARWHQCLHSQHVSLSWLCPSALSSLPLPSPHSYPPSRLIQGDWAICIEHSTIRTAVAYMRVRKFSGSRISQQRLYSSGHFLPVFCCLSLLVMHPCWIVSSIYLFHNSLLDSPLFHLWQHRRVDSWYFALHWMCFDLLQLLFSSYRW